MKTALENGLPFLRVQHVNHGHLHANEPSESAGFSVSDAEVLIGCHAQHTMRADYS